MFHQQVLVQGGLANQMFQYAFFLYLRKNARRAGWYRLNVSSYSIWEAHNGYELDKVFGLDSNALARDGKFWRRWYRHVFIKAPELLVYSERKYVFDTCAATSKKPYLLGYWLNEGYFKDMREEILNVFSFKNVNSINLSIANQMHSENSVSIHVRRGDYLNLPNHFPVCGMDYYLEAVSTICKSVHAPVFYVFSDDPEWCVRNFAGLDVNYKIVDINRGSDSFQDMFLMTQCHHNIIANSTFSWWGAWLNDYSNRIVVAPRRWFSDNDVNICPDEWIRI